MGKSVINIQEFAIYSQVHDWLEISGWERENVQKLWVLGMCSSKFCSQEQSWYPNLEKKTPSFVSNLYSIFVCCVCILMRSWRCARVQGRTLDPLSMFDWLVVIWSHFVFSEWNRLLKVENGSWIAVALWRKTKDMPRPSQEWSFAWTSKLVVFFLVAVCLKSAWGDNLLGYKSCELEFFPKTRCQPYGVGYRCVRATRTFPACETRRCSLGTLFWLHLRSREWHVA